MNRMHKSQIQLMMTYFTLAVAVITFYGLVTNFDVIISWIAWGFNVMGPFIWGFIMAYLLSIPCNALERLLERSRIPFIRKLKKGISVITVYLLFVFSIYMAMLLLVPPIVVAVVDLVSSFPMYYQQLSEFVDNLSQSEQFPFTLSLYDIFEDFFGNNFDIDNPLGGMMTYDAIMSYLGTILGGATHIFRGFLTIVSSIYFLFEAESLGRFLKRILQIFISPKIGVVVLEYGNKINMYFKKYLFCLIIDCIAMAIVAPILLTFIGSPYALFLGILLGVMNFIPYFGSIIATVIAVIVVTLTQGLTMGVISLVILLIAQQLDANVLQPRLYGSSLKLSPLLVIISVTVGGAIGGVIGGAIGGTVTGMVVAIPCVKVIMNILDDIIAYKERKSQTLPRLIEENPTPKHEDGYF